MVVALSIVEPLDSVSLQAPEVEVSLETHQQGNQSITYRLPASAPPETVISFREGIEALERLARRDFSYTLSLESIDGAGADAVRSITYGYQGQQLSEINSYNLRNQALTYLRLVVDALVAFEDQGVYVSLFNAASFTLIPADYNGISRHLKLLDFSSLGRTQAHFKSSRLCLALLLVGLYVGEDNAASEVDKIRSRKLFGALVSQEIPSVVREFVREILGHRRGFLTFRDVARWVYRQDKGFALKWAPIEPVTLLEAVAASKLAGHLKTTPPLVYALLGVGAIGASVYGYIAFGNYVSEAAKTREALKSLPPGLVAMFDKPEPPPPAESLITAASLPVEQPPQAPEPSRAQRALIEYKLWYQRDCQGCDLRGYEFGLEDNLSNINLSGANLTGASIIGSNVAGVNMTGANLSLARLQSLHFLDSTLDSANFTDTQISETFFDGTSARYVDLRGIKTLEDKGYILKFAGVDFSYSNLEYGYWVSVSARDSLKAESEFKGLIFRGAKLKGFRYNYGELQGADFTGADLTDSSFRNTDFQGAILTGANLSGADLFRADLSGVNAIEANFSESVLSGARVKETDFSSADFSNARVRNLKQEESAVINGATFDGANLGMTDFPR